MVPLYNTQYTFCSKDKKFVKWLLSICIDIKYVYEIFNCQWKYLIRLHFFSFNFFQYEYDCIWIIVFVGQYKILL